MMDYQRLKQIANAPNEYEVWSDYLNDYVIDLAWSNDAKKIIAGTASGKVTLYDAETGKLLNEISAHQNGLMSIAVSPSKNIFVTTGQDATINMWNIDTLELLKNIASNSQWVNFVEWSKDGKYFASSEGKVVRVFNEAGDIINTFDQHESTVCGIQWKQDSYVFATACYGGVRLFEVGREKDINFFEWSNSMLSLSWSPDGKFIGCGTQDSRVHFFPVPYENGSDFEMSGYNGKVKLMDWTTDSKYFLTNCWNEIVIWKFAGKSPQGQVPISINTHVERITQVSFQKNSACIASGDEMGFVFFHDTEKPSIKNIGTCLSQEISKLCWSPDGLNLAASTADGKLVIMRTPF